MSKVLSAVYHLKQMNLLECTDNDRKKLTPKEEVSAEENIGEWG
jgi:hypothetical protein